MHHFNMKESMELYLQISISRIIVYLSFKKNQINNQPENEKKKKNKTTGTEGFQCVIKFYQSIFFGLRSFV